MNFDSDRTDSEAVNRLSHQEELLRLNAEWEQQAADLKAVNQTLVESEQRLRLAIETGRIGLWVWNSTDVSNSGDWSERLKEIFGLPLDAEVTHDMFLTCVHPEDRERVNAGVMLALGGANGGEYRIEYRSVHPRDGSEHWVTARGQAFFDAQRQPVRFIGTVMDITERKRAEEAVKQLNLELERRIAERTADLERINAKLQADIEERKRIEEKLQRSERNLTEGQRLTKTGSWELTFETGETDWSVETCRIFGFPDPPPSPHYREFRARVHPEDRDGVDRALRESFETGEPRPLKYRFLLPDGVCKYIETISQPVKYAAGAVARLMGTVMDVTERQRAEETLRGSELLARGQLSALTRTLGALASESVPERVIEHVLRTITEQLGAHSSSVWLRDEARGLMVFEFALESGEFRTKADTPRSTVIPSLKIETVWPWSEVYHTRRPYLLEDIRMGSSLPWHERLLSEGVVGVLIVPMLIVGQVEGVIRLHFTSRCVLRAEELELAQALVNQAMLAVQLNRLSAQSRAAAVTEERNRMAREIHDTLAQGFTGVIVQLEAAEEAMSQCLAEQALAYVERAGELARESLHEARRSVQALRPHALEEKNLCEAWPCLMQKMTAGTALRTAFEVRGERREMPPGWEENLLRIGQEALTNSIRHARASQFQVLLAMEPHEFRVRLADDGRGFDPTRGHNGFGLRGIRERVESMGGKFSIETATDRGTTLYLALPVPGVAEARD